jgi:hypothetical protein
MFKFFLCHINLIQNANFTLYYSCTTHYITILQFVCNIRLNNEKSLRVNIWLKGPIIIHFYFPEFLVEGLAPQASPFSHLWLYSITHICLPMYDYPYVFLLAVQKITCFALVQKVNNCLLSTPYLVKIPATNSASTAKSTIIIWSAVPNNWISFVNSLCIRCTAVINWAPTR